MTIISILNMFYSKAENELNYQKGRQPVSACETAYAEGYLQAVTDILEEVEDE